VIALLQGTKKLFGPLQEGLEVDGVSAVKEVMELQVEAYI
jgi:hypothetical protein